MKNTKQAGRFFRLLRCGLRCGLRTAVLLVAVAGILHAGEETNG